MLPHPIPPLLQHLTPKQLETYYWQARNHDGCFGTVALLQHFLDLFPMSIRLRVRVVEKNKPHEYQILALQRKIIEFHLMDQKSLTLAAVLPDNKTYVSGSDSPIIHAVIGFPASNGGSMAVLDLASLQFGDVGRGFKGRGIFVLETVEDYLSRLNQYATSNTFERAKWSDRMTDAPESDWLREVARRVKGRWDKRETVHWCGHCGAPPPHDRGLMMCKTCKRAYYCDAAHQLAAWPFHKHFCDAGTTSSESTAT
ncbi:hypothetical protein SISSUDRAFT_1123771 [Sistotremastrum suecicum HHB10207 ss-3]|uniref:MYND-type domain-containing protein n=1 Tax=Sistotremastrum suecicum HHB10207 ss-3 TaxID=1314776 RepID=A0A165WTY5_9AGAM|nr:hypothetical protein SISSUDRAFT_1123771 [Sistotremastrum suecicum HHB10207 ss-3]